MRAAEMVRRPDRSGRWGAAAACQRSSSLLDFSRPSLYLSTDHNARENLMTQQTYPRSPKALVGGIAHLGSFIDKVRLRHAELWTFRLFFSNCITFLIPPYSSDLSPFLASLDSRVYHL